MVKEGKILNMINNVKTKSFSSPLGDKCRNMDINYTVNKGGRKLDKPKLKYRFFNSNTPEEFAKAVLAVCIEANAKKAERAIQKELAISIDDGKIGEEDEHSGILQSIDG